MKIRKNAFKKIDSMLEDAVGALHYSSKMQIDDSYDSHYAVCSKWAALDWLRENQHGATVSFEGDRGFMVLRISGPYHFCDSFTVYFDREKFEADKAQYLESEAA